MTMSRNDLFAAAAFEREGFGRTVQYAPPDSWHLESRCPGWTNHDVLAHLQAQEIAASQVVGEEIAPEFEEYRESHDGRLDIDGFNAVAAGKRRESPTRQLAVEWGKAATLMLDRATLASDQDWATHRLPWIAGDIPLRYLVQSRVVEWWLHGEDIRWGAGMDVRLIHESIYMVNDLAIRMIPYALGLIGLVFPGRSVRVELDGAGEGSWHYGLAPGERPSAGKKPDAYIEGRAYRLALVAGRREPADRYLDDGNLVVGGDEDLATTILENIRAYPA
jgi:uncharacterized protein (TIGR03083 family)